MAEAKRGCTVGSVWTPEAGAGTERETSTAPADQARMRLAEILVAHGVAAEDVHLMMPPARRLRRALARQRERMREAALAADPAVCSAARGVCPEHGDTLLPALRGTRCSVRGCHRRWRGERWARHCDQPMVAEVEDPATGRRYRLCAAHLAVERAAVADLRVVVPPGAAPGGEPGG
jgi:hypothetical protein